MGQHLFVYRPLKIRKIITGKEAVFNNPEGAATICEGFNDALFSRMGMVAVVEWKLCCLLVH